MRLRVGYPSRETSLQILDSHGIRSTLDDLKPVAYAADVRQLAELAGTVGRGAELEGLHGRPGRGHPHRHPQVRLAGIVQEMQNSLFRTGYRPSSASRGTQLRDHESQAEWSRSNVLPLHIGAFPACAAGVLKSYVADK